MVQKLVLPVRVWYSYIQVCKQYAVRLLSTPYPYRYVLGPVLSTVGRTPVPVPVRTGTGTVQVQLQYTCTVGTDVRVLVRGSSPVLSTSTRKNTGIESAGYSLQNRTAYVRVLSNLRVALLY